MNEARLPQLGLIPPLEDEAAEVAGRVRSYLADTAERYAPGQSEHYARVALALALRAYEHGNMGVGAVAVEVTQDKVFEYWGEGAMQTGLGVVDHAEVRALLASRRRRPPDATYPRQANAWLAALPLGVSLYASLEPCPMCVCAMTSCGVVGSTSTVLDGEGVYSGGVLVGSTGAACAIGDKAKLQPRVWQEIQAGLGLVFAQLETKDRALQDLSERIFTIRRAKLDMEMASAGEALL
jgi:tRNA(Arg) A34 adenosine deaminase TadA